MDYTQKQLYIHNCKYLNPEIQNSNEMLKKCISTETNNDKKYINQVFKNYNLQNSCSSSNTNIIQNNLDINSNINNISLYYDNKNIEYDKTKNINDYGQNYTKLNFIDKDIKSLAY
tara:strand:+ start:60 stop:407 length:348 start_codon:yes stop_codon:yes gene_type:complete